MRGTIDAVFPPFFGRVDPLAVLRPVEASFVVDLDEVFLALFARQVAHLLALELFARARRQVDVEAFAVVEPVEEVFVRVGGFPGFVVFA